jgi:hypothetical protein
VNELWDRGIQLACGCILHVGRSLMSLIEVFGAMLVVVVVVREREKELRGSWLLNFSVGRLMK